MPFVGPSVSVTSVGTKHWSMDRPLIYEGRDDIFVVPEEFITDFASVPRILMSLVPPYGKWTRAAILHDWLCTVGIERGIVSSRDADGIFRRVMHEEGVNFVLRWLMWVAVRWAAFLNPLRRPGTWRDLWRMVPISAATLGGSYYLARAVHDLAHRLL